MPRVEFSPWLVWPANEHVPSGVDGRIEYAIGEEQDVHVQYLRE